jgi:hypothetical protein
MEQTRSSKVKVSFFYRDGANYKCHFTKEIDKQIIDDLEIDVENDIDTKYRSDVLFEIEDFGLKVFDIPAIAEWGFDPEYDHNYVSITKIEEVDS